jgi:hypothetical protein
MRVIFGPGPDIGVGLPALVGLGCVAVVVIGALVAASLRL